MCYLLVFFRVHANVLVTLTGGGLQMRWLASLLLGCENFAASCHYLEVTASAFIEPATIAHCIIMTFQAMAHTDCRRSQELPRGRPLCSRGPWTSTRRAHKCGSSAIVHHALIADKEVGPTVELVPICSQCNLFALDSGQKYDHSL